MKINGKITVLINLEQTMIDIIDHNANITFARIVLTPTQLSSALSRMAYTDCQVELTGLDKLGKKMESKSFEFEIKYSKSQEDLTSACAEALSDKGMNEWVSDNYFSSQNTFFEKDGKKYARTIIRRWV